MVAIARMIQLFMFITFAALVVSQKPAWCAAGAAAQADNTYSLCKQNSNTETPAGIGSWCQGKNFFSTKDITLRDRFFQNCTNPLSRCIEAPGEPQYSNLYCYDTPDPNGIVSSDGFYKQACRNVNFALPVTILDTFTNTKREMLIISAQGGLVVVDMGLEKILFKAIVPAGNLTFMQVVPGTMERFAHVFGVGGLGSKLMFSWKLAFDATTGVFTAVLEATGELPGTVQDMIAFYDVPAQTKFAAMVVSTTVNTPPKIYFVPIGGTSLPLQQIWTLSGIPVTTFVKIEMVQHLNIDKTANMPNVQCFPPTATGQRSLILVHTNSAVWIYGFVQTNIGNQDLDLTIATTVGRSLVYQPVAGAFITSAWAHGECFGNYDVPSQSLWLSVATRNAAKDNFLNLVPLPEFSWVDMTCITDGALWWRMPSGNRKTGAGCVHAAPVCVSHTQYASQDGDNFPCVERTIIPPVTISGSAIDIVSTQATDSKTTTNVGELGITYMTNIFVTSQNTVDVFGVQEIVCGGPTSIPIVGTMNRLTYPEGIVKATPSPNGQHLFTSTEKRDWEVDSHQRLVQICADLLTNPAAGLYNDKFREMCQNPTGLLSIYDFITYHSSCNGGLHCPQYGWRAPRSSAGRTDLLVVPGNHVLRPTKIWPCAPGFFCPGQVDSLRRICPVGFKCPDASMISPIRCFTGEAYENGCLNEGQTTEIGMCPPGAICKAPQKAIPAPPGYSVGTGSRKLLTKCADGDLCTLEASNSTFTLRDGSYQCPGGFYCPTPDTVAPIPCFTMYDAGATTVLQNFTEYCPPGTSGEFPHPCPAEFECPDLVSAKRCEDGYFCPVGTQFANACLPGTYCPTPSAFLSCPRDYYCREATQNPRQCQWLVWCPEQSSSEKYAFGALAFDLGLVIFIFFTFQCARVCCAAIRKKRKKKKFLGKNEGYTEALTALVMDEEEDEMEEDEQMLGERTDGILEKKNFTIDLTLRDVNVTRLKTGKLMMRSVSGRIYHNRVTCVMAARTEDTGVFLDIISGRAHYAKIEGKIKVNGNVEENMSSLLNITGFVDRKDLMIPSFKVEENIRFSAHSRLPYMTTYSDITHRINCVLSVLHMEHIRNKHVGKKSDDEFKGLTNYQRKLSSVAMELVADPSLMLLEHPLDGLLPGEAYQLLNSLKTISRKGLTVIVAVNKPRYEVFKHFDDLLLLGKNGETVYSGPSIAVVRYFEEEGFKCEQFKNPADFIVDIVQGNCKRQGDDDFKVDNLVDLWEKKQQEVGKPWSIPDEDPMTQTEMDNAPKTIMSSEEHLIHQMTEQEKNRKRPAFVAQFFQYWIRTTLELVRHVKGQLFDFFMYVILASILGAVYFNMDFLGPPTKVLQQLCPDFVRDRLCSQPRLDRVGVTLALSSFGLASLAMFSSFKIFGVSKDIYRKEVQNGINKGSFYLGKVVAYIPSAFILPFIFQSVWFALIVPRANFGAYYGLFVLIQLTWSSYGILISIAMKRDHAGFYGLLGLILAGFLSGFSPTLQTFVDSGAWYAIFLMFLSPLSYAFQSLYLLEIETYRADNVDVTSTLKAFGFEKEFFGWIIVVQIIFIIVFNLAAFLVLYFKDPRAIESFKVLFKSCYRKHKGQKKVIQNFKDPSLLEEFDDTDQEDTLMDDEPINQSLLLNDDERQEAELQDINRE